MNRPLVLFILPDLGGGGAQKVMLQIAGALDRNHFEPRLMVLGGAQEFETRIPAEIEAEMGRAKRLRDGLPWVIRRIRALAPDVCVSVMGYVNLALLAAKPLLPRKTRLVIREANALSPTFEALPRAVPGRALYRTLYPRADAIVSPTREIASELTALSPQLAQRSSVIPNPVDTARLRQEAVPMLRHSGEGLRFVSAGRLTRQKGYDRLVEMLPAFPHDAHITVFGNGPDRSALESQVAMLGVGSKITFFGFTSDLPAWIAGADAFLLPSRWEGLPNVVLEALAVGTPSIVTNEAAVSELAEKAPAGALSVCPVGDRFVAAARHVAERGKSSGPNPQLLPDEYMVSEVAARWDSLLARVVGADPGTRGS